MSCVTWCNYVGPIPEKTDPESELQQWDIILAQFSNWFNNEVLGVYEGITPTIPTKLYVAVHTTASNPTSPGTEIVDSGYARSLITFDRVSDIQRWSAVDVLSPSAQTLWEALSFTIWDDPVGGNYYAFGNLSQPLTIDVGKSILWPKNKVILGMGASA